MSNKLLRWQITLTLFFFGACSPTFQVQNINTAPNPNKKNGVFYVLPKKEYDIVITYEKTVEKPSRLIASLDTNLVSNILATIKDNWGFEYTKKPKISYEIKTIELITRVVQDSTQIYFVKFRRPNALFLKQSFNYEFNESGFMTSANTQSEDNTLGFVTNTLTALGQVVGAVLNPKSAKIQEFEISQIQNFISDANNPMVTNLINLVNRINEIKQKRKAIFSGNAESKELIKNPESLTYIYNKLSEEETNLLNLLKGTKQTSEEKLMLAFDIQKDTTQTLKNLAGVLDTNKYKGLLEELAKVKINVTNKSSDGTTGVTNIIGDFVKKQKDSVDKKNQGIWYRIPAQCLVSFTNTANGFKYLQKIEAVPQLGTVAFLPTKVGKAKNGFIYGLDPNTGALLKFEASGEGANMETVSKFYESLPSIAEKLKKPEENQFQDLEDKVKAQDLEIKIKEQQLKLDSLNKKKE